VTVDGLGNIYLATVYNTSGSFPSGTIRMVTASNGYISTIAGGTIFAGTSSGNGGPAAIAQIGYSSVTGLAIDSSNNLYFIDGNFVRQVNASTGMINAVAGNGTTTWATGVAALSTGMNGPSAPFIDGSGNFYLQENGYIRKIANLVNSAGLTSTIAGTGTAGYSGDGGPATSAKISSPTGITMDGSGNLYIVDSGTTASASYLQASSIPSQATVRQAIQATAALPPAQRCNIFIQ
jgi:hypothetical protein